ncbi:hypothetical protein B0H15DRAFT_826043 [Mycena belliarum]|uniref:Uncharacterized protein n=1 Tax=Mycena belliarum TaxID=1033014 RepID=A0AAD6XUI7_9AGAR|nr:hypothetical protein B0H15DRAFT_826043 [Mycena belliae]
MLSYPRNNGPETPCPSTMEASRPPHVRRSEAIAQCNVPFRRRVELARGALPSSHCVVPVSTYLTFVEIRYLSSTERGQDARDIGRSLSHNWHRHCTDLGSCRISGIRLPVRGSSLPDQVQVHLKVALSNISILRRRCFAAEGKDYRRLSYCFQVHQLWTLALNQLLALAADTSFVRRGSDSAGTYQKNDTGQKPECGGVYLGVFLDHRKLPNVVF